MSNRYGPSDAEYEAEYGQPYTPCPGSCSPSRGEFIQGQEGEQYIRLPQTSSIKTHVPKWLSFRASKAQQKTIGTNQTKQLSSGQDEIELGVIDGEVVREWKHR